MADLDNRIRRTTRFYLRKVNRAVSTYGLISPGDRIAVAVSGGKDSLSMLRLLRDRRTFFPPQYEIVALHVAYRGWEVGAPPRAVITGHFEREGVPYEVVEVDLTGEEVDCFRCSWLRRKALFTTAQRLGCNKLALAHNLEDIVETTLLNLFQHGRLERPEPCTALFGGRLTLIRPLVFFTAHELRRFAHICGLPVYESTCPHSKTSQRAQIGACLRELHKARRELYINVYRAMERYGPLDDRQRARRRPAERTEPDP
jgi:tRNA 2-thiocytidine biosynthesis protein TtcA